MVYLLQYLCDKVKKYLIQLFIACVLQHTYYAALDKLYMHIENLGYYTYKESKNMTFSEFAEKIRTAHDATSNETDLPTTDEIFPYLKGNGTPHLQLINYANRWLEKEQEKIDGYLRKITYLKMEEIIKNRIKAYDTMDDISRLLYPLYIKRIKLKNIKELIGAESYDNITLPPIVPPEFIEIFPKK